jgi:N-acyl-D-amino-acid deacylase
MADYDIIIKGGTIVDGLRTPRYIGDLAIKDGKVAKIGGLRKATADKVLDAAGLIVAPGFIDSHTHYDAQIQWDPYCTASGWHGVTSVIIGNCGFGFAPCSAKQEDRDRMMLSLTRNEAIPYNAMKEGMLWDWETFPDFLDSLDRIPKGVNLISYVPLSPIYSWVMGYDESKKRRPTEAELKEMCRLLEVGLDAGACGWSAQVLGPDSVQRDYDGTPMVTDLMTNEELIAFARVLGERDEGSIELAYSATGIADEISQMPESSKKLFEKLAEVSGRPVIHQAVVSYDHDANQHRAKLAWLEDCVNRGLRVYGQGLTLRSGKELTFEDWNLFDDAPEWRKVTLGTVAERKAKMEDPETRAALRAEWDSGIRPSASIPEGLTVLQIEQVGRRDFEHYIGQSIQEIADKEGKHVIDALLDIVVGDNLQTELFGPSARYNAQNSAEIVNSPYSFPGASDGGAHVKFSPGGVYPTDTLTWLVRDEGVVTLEEAHYKLSYLPGFMGGFRDRGFLREGAPADIVVYDLENLAMGPLETARDLPDGDWRRIQKAEGYRWILVNGQVTLEDGNPTGNMSGKLLRHGSA